jgi:uncharacterized protein (TIGR02594 family)
MGDSPQSDLYALFRRAWKQKRWLTLALFIPASIAALVIWNAVESVSDRVGKSLGTIIAERIKAGFSGHREPMMPAHRVVSSGPTPWLEVAYQEMGQREIPGPGNNSRILEYISAVQSTENVQDDAVDWASAFVEWSLNQVNIRGPKTMEPRNWLNWGRIINAPERGCIVVFAFGDLTHVGFYINEDDTNYLILGGNQSDEVRISHFLKARALGYRLPP